MELNGNEYNIEKLSVKKQFHLSRKLAPLILTLGKAINSDRPDNEAGALGALVPVAEILSKMSDEDSEYVLDMCLSVVSRKQGDKFAKIQAPNGLFMFSDIDLQTAMQLVAAVVRDNLGNFFSTLSIQA